MLIAFFLTTATAVVQATNCRIPVHYVLGGDRCTGAAPGFVVSAVCASGTGDPSQTILTPLTHDNSDAFRSKVTGGVKGCAIPSAMTQFGTTAPGTTHEDITTIPDQCLALDTNDPINGIRTPYKGVSITCDREAGFFPTQGHEGVSWCLPGAQVTGFFPGTENMKDAWSEIMPVPNFRYNNSDPRAHPVEMSGHHSLRCSRSCAIPESICGHGHLGRQMLLVDSLGFNAPSCSIRPAHTEDRVPPFVSLTCASVPLRERRVFTLRCDGGLLTGEYNGECGPSTGAITRPLFATSLTGRNERAWVRDLVSMPSGALATFPLVSATVARAPSVVYGQGGHGTCSFSPRAFPNGVSVYPSGDGHDDDDDHGHGHHHARRAFALHRATARRELRARKARGAVLLKPATVATALADCRLEELAAQESGHGHARAAEAAVVTDTAAQASLSGGTGLAAAARRVARLRLRAASAAESAAAAVTGAKGAVSGASGALRSGTTNGDQVQYVIDIRGCGDVPSAVRTLCVQETIGWYACNHGFPAGDAYCFQNAHTVPCPSVAECPQSGGGSKKGLLGLLGLLGIIPIVLCCAACLALVLLKRRRGAATKESMAATVLYPTVVSGCIVSSPIVSVMPSRLGSVPTGTMIMTPMMPPVTAGPLGAFHSTPFLAMPAIVPISDPTLMEYGPSTLPTFMPTTATPCNSASSPAFRSFAAAPLGSASLGNLNTFGQSHAPSLNPSPVIMASPETLPGPYQIGGHYYDGSGAGVPALRFPVP